VALTYAVIKCGKAPGTKDNHLPPLEGLSRYKTDGNTVTFERVLKNPDKAGEKKTVEALHRHVGHIGLSGLHN